MKMENIMNYKLLLYAFDILLCIYACSCINFEKFIKKDKVIETRILSLVISIVLGYLFTNFIIDFLEISKIV